MTNFEDLAEMVIAKIGRDHKVIGIDGIDGVGKTPLAELISERLGIPLVSIDDYLVKEENCYVGALRPSMKDAALNLSGSGIVEGVCLLAVADKFEFQLDCHIYLKRTHLNMWADEDWCETDLLPEQIVAREEDQLFAFEEWDTYQKKRPCRAKDEVKLSVLRSELISYHHNYSPHKVANFVFEIEHA